MLLPLSSTFHSSDSVGEGGSLLDLPAALLPVPLNRNRILQMSVSTSPRSLVLPVLLGASFGAIAMYLFKRSRGPDRRLRFRSASYESSTHSHPLSPRGGGAVSSSGLLALDQFSPMIDALRDVAITPLRGPSSSSSSSSPQVLVVGIAGGSGSGKTTLAEAIFSALGRDANVTFLSHDRYYKDLSSWTMSQRANQNFDHPRALDTELLVSHVRSLKLGHSVSVPTYDFATHTRTNETTVAVPRRVILVEGILIFADPSLASLLDVKIFVDTESDVRLIRRIARDCQERGRSLEEVLSQYGRTVRPMHNEFVEPSKRQADIIVPVGLNAIALGMITE